MSQYRRTGESYRTGRRNSGIRTTRERAQQLYYNPKLSARPVPEFVQLLDIEARGPVSSEVYYRLRTRREELKRQVLHEAYNAVYDLTFLVEQEVHDCSPFRGHDSIFGDILPLLENQMRRFQEMKVTLEVEANREYLVLF